MDLNEYHIILVNSSAGKDSQAMLDEVCVIAKEQGVIDRVVVFHADLGKVEWKGTKELAERQAKHSDFKRAPIRKVMTALVKEIVDLEIKAFGKSLGQIRILNCLGLRAEESPARSKKREYEVDVSARNGKRLGCKWLPIHNVP